MSESFQTLNERLASIYGNHAEVNKPKYRLVFTSTEREKRIGVFEDYYGDIFIRRVLECREVPKYPNNPDRIAIEFLQRNLANPELQADWSYETIWIYNAKGKEGGFYFPTWPGIQLVVGSHILGLQGKSAQEHINEALANEDREIAEEAQYIMDVLGEEMRSPLFESESAVSYAGLDAKLAGKVKIGNVSLT